VVVVVVVVGSSAQEFRNTAIRTEKHGISTFFIMTKSLLHNQFAPNRFGRCKIVSGLATKRIRRAESIA